MTHGSFIISCVAEGSDTGQQREPLSCECASVLKKRLNRVFMMYVLIYSKVWTINDNICGAKLNIGRGCSGQQTWNVLSYPSVFIYFLSDSLSCGRFSYSYPHKQIPWLRSIAKLWLRPTRMCAMTTRLLSGVLSDTPTSGILFFFLLI